MSTKKKKKNLPKNKILNLLANPRAKFYILAVDLAAVYLLFAFPFLKPYEPIFLLLIGLPFGGWIILKVAEK